MGIKSIYERNQYGQRLILFENDGSNAINVLQGLRQSLPQLRDITLQDGFPAAVQWPEPPN